MDWYRLLPPYWFQNKPTDRVWSNFVSDAVDRGDVRLKGKHTALVGGREVWVSNYPYAFGSPYDATIQVLPTVAVRKKLRRALIDLAISGRSA